MLKYKEFVVFFLPWHRIGYPELWKFPGMGIDYLISGIMTSLRETYNGIRISLADICLDRWNFIFEFLE